MNNRTSESPLEQGPMPLPGTEARFHRFRVGNIDCLSLSDGAILAPLSSPPSPGKSASAHASAPPDKPLEFRLVPLSCLLVTLPKTGKVVLMDGGFGFNPELLGKPGRSDGRLIESLAAAGISPESIDVVLISHLDPDHIGGLLLQDGSKRYPNAIYYAGAEEVAFWSQDPLDLSYSPSPEPVKRERLSASGRLLRFAGNAIKTFRAGEEVIPGISTIALPGHTPGQVGFIVEGEPESLLYTADCIVHPVTSVETPHVYNPMDLDPETGVQSRVYLLDMLFEKNLHSFSPHFPWPSVGRVERANEQAVWKSAPLHTASGSPGDS